MSEGILLCVGHPLLDIIAKVDSEFLQKFYLKANNAVRADEAIHRNLIPELISKHQVKYVAGGSAQNTARYAQWVFGKNSKRCVSFMGTVGNDYFAKTMEERAVAEGVNAVYIKIEQIQTGRCAVLISDGGLSRSLCAFLDASQMFNEKDLIKNWKYVESAKVIYITGFLLGTSFDAISKINEFIGHNSDRHLAFNLSAPYVSEQYGQRIINILYYIDIFVASYVDIIAFAEFMKLKEMDLKKIVRKICFEMPCIKKQRFVIVTQGKDPVIIGDRLKGDIIEFNVPFLDEAKILDTNGAGDAFVGGLLASFIAEKSIHECIKCGVQCAQQIIQVSGCEVPIMEYEDIKNILQ
ncbi:adenosine kinase 2-like protein [Dinothrombium tinctorium]|uniref:Adenosine kinase n=1 Tax=Dinothrombium tinctorium TaxID=1965070 RepID=A0A3S3P018_9ACAR|nr:adenosine kinase 2-like protein [Dinothrombium tinctorium]RWS05138.1 adenosine kinase 2-like protein [Dinothrombium tinctorium]